MVKYVCVCTRARTHTHVSKGGGERERLQSKMPLRWWASFIFWNTVSSSRYPLCRWPRWKVIPQCNNVESTSSCNWFYSKALSWDPVSYPFPTWNLVIHKKLLPPCYRCCLWDQKGFGQRTRGKREGRLFKERNFCFPLVPLFCPSKASSLASHIIIYLMLSLPTSSHNLSWLYPPPYNPVLY